MTFIEYWSTKWDIHIISARFWNILFEWIMTGPWRELNTIFKYFWYNVLTDRLSAKHYVKVCWSKTAFFRKKRWGIAALSNRSGNFHQLHKNYRNIFLGYWKNPSFFKLTSSTSTKSALFRQPTNLCFGITFFLICRSLDTSTSKRRKRLTPLTVCSC